jgi:hypothetical protein
LAYYLVGYYLLALAIDKESLRMQLRAEYCPVYRHYLSHFDGATTTIDDHATSLGAAMVAWVVDLIPLMSTDLVAAGVFDQQIWIYDHFSELANNDVSRWQLFTQAMELVKATPESARQPLIGCDLQPTESLVCQAIDHWPLRVEILDSLTGIMTESQTLKLLIAKYNTTLFRIWSQRFGRAVVTYHAVLETIKSIVDLFHRQSYDSLYGRLGSDNHNWMTILLEACPSPTQLECGADPDETVALWDHVWDLVHETDLLVESQREPVKRYLLRRPLISWVSIGACRCLIDQAMSQEVQAILHALFQQSWRDLELNILMSITTVLCNRYWNTDYQSQIEILLRHIIRQIGELTPEQQTGESVTHHCLSFPHAYFVEAAEQIPLIGESCLGYFNEVWHLDNQHIVDNIKWLMEKQPALITVQDVELWLDTRYISPCGLRMICQIPSLRQRLLRSSIIKCHKNPALLAVLWSCREYIEAPMLTWLVDLVNSTEEPSLMTVIAVTAAK